MPWGTGYPGSGGSTADANTTERNGTNAGETGAGSETKSPQETADSWSRGATSNPQGYSYGSPQGYEQPQNNPYGNSGYNQNSYGQGSYGQSSYGQGGNAQNGYGQSSYGTNGYASSGYDPNTGGYNQGSQGAQNGYQQNYNNHYTSGNYTSGNYNTNYNSNYTQNTNYNNPYNGMDTTPLSMGEWLLTLLAAFIPCAGIILYLIWAFSSSGNLHRRNFCRAYLIVELIAIILVFIFASVTAASGLYYYY